MNPSRKYWLIFDLDDTLGGVEVEGNVIGTTAAYCYIERRIGEICQVHFGVPAGKYVQLTQTIQAEAVKEHGFGKLDLFPRKCIEAFEMIREKHAIASKVQDQVVEWAWRIYEYENKPLPGAVEVLASLSKDYRIAIVTKGNEQLQRKKIFDMGLFPYVDVTRVMNFKNYDEWDDFLGNSLRMDMPTSIRSWAIGNSILADVNPPVAYGLNGVLLEGAPTWKYEETDKHTEPVQQGRQFHTISKLNQLFGIIPALTQQD